MGREPAGEDGLLIYQAASAICGLALFLVTQLFIEEPETSARFRHGDYSTSNPSHPHVFSVTPTIQTRCDKGPGVFGLTELETPEAAAYLAEAPLHLPALLAFADDLALVHLGASLSERQLHLGLAVPEVEPERHQGEAPLLYAG